MTKSIQSIDQEDERRRLSAILLKELVEEFRANGIKVSSTKDSITINGVRFELMDTPSDVHNEVIYIVSPDNQSIPVRKENYGEAIDVIMDYIETQGVGESMEKSFENGRGYDMQPIEDVLTHYADSFDPSAFMDDVRQQMVELDERPEFKRVKEMIDRWNTTESRSDTAIRGHMDDADEIRQPIRDWYTSAYPTDDLGHSMSDITFDDLYSGLSSGLDVYDKIGVGDSIVRERLFDRLAEIKRVSYNDIYNLWLNNARKGVRKSGKGLKKYATNVKKLPNPVLIMCENRTIEVPYQYDPYDSWDRRYTELDMGEFIITISISSSDPFTEVEYHINALNSQTRGGLSGADSYHGRMDIDYAISSGFSEVSDALDHAINGAKLSNIKGGAYWYHDKDNPLLPSGNYWYGDGEWVSKSMRKSSTKKSKKLSKNMKKYVEGAVPLPDPIILNVNGQRYELKSDSAYIPTSMDFRKAEIRMDDIVIVARVEVKEPYFTYDWSVVAYRNNGWGSKIYEVEPYYGFNIPIEEGIATDFREISDALDHVIQDYRMQAISGYYPDSDITRGMMKSKKLSKNSIDAMVDRIAFACQCDNPLVREINGYTILMMDVHDSDCEYYFEEYDIYQEEIDGKTYNCVNLSRLSKGVRKHRMLSKKKHETRKSVQSFSMMLDSIRKRASMSNAQLPDDYPNHSEGTFVVHRKVNYESMYPQRFDNREDYESFCRELENKGWTRGREYVDNDGAEVTYFRDTD